MKNRILELLKQHGLVELETEESVLVIRFRKFFGVNKEFHFELNARAIDSCKTEKAALNRIESFIDRGFVLSEI